ncbi:DAK2 domain-containing protein [Arthrobacter celericrescens]|uniref:DAK2 domain-containing protein n=1 Tax=Arthrobacter celericrescens TaxID=2320851 RepID=UPI000EA1CAF4|nr:DAK2 domain-containing protein [Arthrobacter celericrescens]
MKRWLGKAETTLGNHSDRINAINIFPVADGDTGTNLYLTVRAATAALSGVEAKEPRSSEGGQAKPEPAKPEQANDVGAVLAAAGRAAMEQARGNSGTLFAVFLCAMAEPLAGHSRLSAPLLAAALHRAQIRSWSALSEPVSGTMLSVLEAAAQAAGEVDAAQNGDDSNQALGLALDAAVDAAVRAVVRTEEQLAPLHEAHVVDAGGVGMLLVLDCLRSAVLGEELQDELLDGLHGYDVQDPHIHTGLPDDEGVEVMCTIELSPLAAATLRQKLDELGDSVIMSQVGSVAGPGSHDGDEHDDDDADGIEASYRWRVHVHVPEAGPAVEAIRALGEPSDISVSQLALPRDSDAGPDAASAALESFHPHES